jgi:hypothetical protein
MTANYIARVVESLYEKVDLDEITTKWKDIKRIDYGRVPDEWVNRKIESKSYYRWLKACGILETYCTMNMGKFKETELVYKWAKDGCIRQNNLLNEFRAYSWGVYTFDEWYKKRK